MPVQWGDDARLSDIKPDLVCCRVAFCQWPHIWSTLAAFDIVANGSNSAAARRCLPFMVLPPGQR
jgi:hypothetical protein